jgi:hypothetical protein
MFGFNRVGRDVCWWLGQSCLEAVKRRVQRSIPAVVALGGLLFCTPSGADPSGYAALVRRVSPSVVTILV